MCSVHFSRGWKHGLFFCVHFFDPKNQVNVFIVNVLYIVHPLISTGVLPSRQSDRIIL